jgi:hypothetical protein
MYSSFANELVSTLMFVHTSSIDKDDLDKKTLNSTYYVNIKSKGLRNILRTILRDIRTINLNEDKPTIKLFFDLVA